mmetsp:Transcript_149020/g.263511  ORF Transcript_149020/g.263511 Transcript_149020/m.263511 type:complete len:157 (-) Transcript_149020:282-752(-)
MEEGQTSRQTISASSSVTTPSARCPSLANWGQADFKEISEQLENSMQQTEFNRASHMQNSHPQSHSMHNLMEILTSESNHAPCSHHAIAFLQVLGSAPLDLGNHVIISVQQVLGCRRSNKVALCRSGRANLKSNYRSQRLESWQGLHAGTLWLQTC